MYKVAVITMGIRLDDEKGYTRFRSVCEFLADAGYQVDLITTTFQHWEKAQRDLEKIKNEKYKFGVKFIYEPGYNTTHPITATLISSGMSATISSTWFASLIRSILVLPQVGQDTTSIPPLRSPSVLRISFAVRISSTGSPVRETRIVLPIPSWRMIPSPTEDFTFPEYTVPDSVIPT